MLCEVIFQLRRWANEGLGMEGMRACLRPYDLPSNPSTVSYSIPSVTLRRRPNQMRCHPPLSLVKDVRPSTADDPIYCLALAKRFLSLPCRLR